MSNGGKQLKMEEVIALLALLEHHGIRMNGTKIQTADDLLQMLSNHGLSRRELEIVTLADILLLLDAYGIRPTGWLEKMFWRLIHHLAPNRFTIRITQESNMQAGSTGSFLAQLQDNGSTIPTPAGTSFTWNTSDTTVTITPGADTTTATLTVPADSTSTSLTVSATCTAPDGSVASGSLVLTLTPGTGAAQKYSIAITQTA